MFIKHETDECHHCSWARHQWKHARKRPGEQCERYERLPRPTGGRTLGTLSAYTQHSESIDPHQVELLATFANQAAISLDNAQLYSELSSRLEEMVGLQRLGTLLLEEHDFDRVLHSICRQLQRLTDAGGVAQPRALNAADNAAGALTVKILRATPAANDTGIVRALDLKGLPLGEAQFTFNAADRETEARFELPVELRNEMARLEIAGERSAGAVQLLDKRWRRRTTLRWWKGAASCCASRTTSLVW